MNRGMRYLACSCVGALQVACSGSKPKLTELVVAPFSTAIDYAPYYVAKEFKWLDSDPALRGIRVVYGAPFSGFDQIYAALDGHRLDALFAAEPPMIVIEASGREIRIVGLSCTLKQEILVRAELPITSPTGLNHRKIAVLQGTSSYYGLLRVLGSVGLTKDSVEIDPMGPVDAKAAFEAGRIDAWAVWPPFVEEEQLAGKGRVLPGGDAVIQSVMAVSSDLIRDHRPIVEALVGTLLRAKQFIISNPAEAQRIVARSARIDSAVVRAAWGKHSFAATLDSSVIRDIQNKADFLFSEHSTRGNQPIDVRARLIDTTFLVHSR